MPCHDFYAVLYLLIGHFCVVFHDKKKSNRALVGMPYGRFLCFLFCFLFCLLFFLLSRNEWEIQFHEEMICVVIFHCSTLKRINDTLASIP